MHYSQLNKNKIKNIFEDYELFILENKVTVKYFNLWSCQWYVPSTIFHCLDIVTNIGLLAGCSSLMTTHLPWSWVVVTKLLSRRMSSKRPSFYPIFSCLLSVCSYCRSHKTKINRTPWVSGANQWQIPWINIPNLLYFYQ